MDEITIALNEQDQKFLALVFAEIFYGGSTQSIQKILGDSVEGAFCLQPKVELQSEAGLPSLTLTVNEWRVMYESLNAMIYGLGPNELYPCTEYTLEEACNVNLKICAAVWGASGVGSEWLAS